MKVMSKILPMLPLLSMGLSNAAAPAESPYATPLPQGIQPQLRLQIQKALIFCKAISRLKKEILKPP